MAAPKTGARGIDTPLVPRLLRQWTRNSDVIEQIWDELRRLRQTARGAEEGAGREKNGLIDMRVMDKGQIIAFVLVAPPNGSEAAMD
ncbi:hypothetical protein AVEN_169955-1 [Araneus ventricosus]|uniref:Uncharacterized protein n=1 Tax=Araneus ventricosus TaxID=182803 RepID=A0A4Y2M1S2_ARAVE|nr:hypothetical protein AVEN_169955-1 [Araneus ventricosus]